MTRRILIDAVHQDEVKVVMAEDTRLEEFDFETSSKRQIKSNIYLGKITRVEPSLQAAFVEYGGSKQGFLPFSEIHFDYYQIPVEDREKLEEAISKAEARASKLEEEEAQRTQAQTASVAKAEKAEEADYAAKADEAPAEKKPKKRGRPSKAELEARKAAREAEEAKKAAQAETGNDNIEEIDDPEDNPEEDLPVSQQLDDEEVDAADDDIASEIRGARSELYRQYSKYKIQEVIKRNQIVLVQVIKEERGNKGASLTTFISLAGRHCVFMPNTDRQGGVSRRIANIGERRRLRNIVSQLEGPKGSSIIVRTAGVDKSETEIKSDFDYLLSVWEEIRARTLDSEAPAMIHEEGNLVKRSLRDLYRSGIDEIVVEGDEAYKTCLEFMETLSPDHKKKVIQHKDNVPIFRKYKIDAQLEELYDNTARLKSGGYVVITPTEALVSIDVNSGKSTRGRNIEETALQTNLEAAAEVARQLRLRDLAGLVVIDFIDMRELRNRRAVERALKDALRVDRAKIQVGRISSFGLLEMSRQRMRSSIVEASAISCPNCSGTGMVRSNESISITLLRVIEIEAAKVARQGYGEVRLRASTAAAFYLLNNKRDEIGDIEDRFGVKVLIDHDHHLYGTDYEFDRPRGRRGRDGASRKKYTRKDAANSNAGEDGGEDYKPRRGRPPRGKAAARAGSADDSNYRDDSPDDDRPKRRGRPRKNVSDSGDGGRPRRGRPPRARDNTDGIAAEKDSRPARGRSDSRDGRDNRDSRSNTREEISETDSTKLKGLWQKMTQ